MIPKGGDGAGVDGDDARLAGLRRPRDELRVDDLDRAGDVDARVVLVEGHVVPCEVEQLATSRAGVCGEAEEGEESVVLEEREEGSQVLAGH